MGISKVSEKKLEKSLDDQEMIDLVHDEGFRLNPYKDTKGYITGGIGHKMDQQDMKDFDYNWSNEQKEDFWIQKFHEDFINSAAEAEAILNEQGIEANPTVDAVVTNMVFNMGATEVRNNWPNFFKALKEENYEEAIHQMKTSSNGQKMSQWYTEVPTRVERLGEKLAGLIVEKPVEQPVEPKRFPEPYAAQGGWIPKEPKSELAEKPRVAEPFATKGTKPPNDYGYGKRIDGTLKGPGYFGELDMGNGKIITELSMGVLFDGKETEIPTIVPTLTDKELRYLMSGGRPTPAIRTKAIQHAKKRLQLGLSPFATEKDQNLRGIGFPNRK